MTPWRGVGRRAAPRTAGHPSRGRDTCGSEGRSPPRRALPHALATRRACSSEGPPQVPLVAHTQKPSPQPPSPGPPGQRPRASSLGPLSSCWSAACAPLRRPRSRISRRRLLTLVSSGPWASTSSAMELLAPPLRSPLPPPPPPSPPRAPPPSRPPLPLCACWTLEPGPDGVCAFLVWGLVACSVSVRRASLDSESLS